MLAPRPALWTMREAARQFGMPFSTIRNIVNRYQLGDRHEKLIILQRSDCHAIVWQIYQRRWHDHPPWESPEAPAFRRVEHWTLPEILQSRGQDLGPLSSEHIMANLMLRQFPELGFRLGGQWIMTPSNRRRYEYRRRHLHSDRRRYRDWIRDPQPPKIIIDKAVLSIYNRIMEDRMGEEKTKRRGRAANGISIYPTDEQVQWLESKRLERPYLKRSQVIVEILQKVMERESYE